MAIVSHRISGLDALRDRLAGLPGIVRTAAGAGLLELAENAADAARADLASSPGPPASGIPSADRWGRLASTITATSDPERDRATVAVAAPDARFLEYGTAKMAARPFLRPAALKAGRGARAILRAALRRGLAP